MTNVSLIANKLALLVFREFEAGINLMEDYDQIARNFLGKIREVYPYIRLLLLIHDADEGRFIPAAGGMEEDIKGLAFRVTRRTTAAGLFQK